MCIKGIASPQQHIMQRELLCAANKRVYSLLSASSVFVANQLSIKHKEACFQKALGEEVSIQLPVELEAPCPVVFVRSDGRQKILSAERIDLLITSETRKWAAIVEIKRGLNTLASAIAQVTRYKENYASTHSVPLAGAFVVIFYGAPTQCKIVNCANK